LVPAAASSAVLSIERLNELSAAGAAAALAPLFEGAPRFLRRLSAARPFRSWDELFERASEIAEALPEEEQIELIDAHPRLGAPPGQVSAMSFREQGYDRRESSDDLAAELERLNDAYESRFGFRFCVFVAGRPRSDMPAVIAAALGENRASELQRALGDVVAIARDRHRGMAARKDSA
jgi:2-oxo-4-hydroxy-4-carboxy-5-ureidoimidazoline decarboxylase